MVLSNSDVSPPYVVTERVAIILIQRGGLQALCAVATCLYK